jgi:hypothetical protein
VNSLPKSLTAKAAKEKNSLTAKDAKSAKKSIIKTNPRARRSRAKGGKGSAIGMPVPKTDTANTARASTGYRSSSVTCMPPLARFLRDLKDLLLSLLLFPSR